MFNRNMTSNVQQIIKQHINQHMKQQLIAVDATLGNGFDLEFLNVQNNIYKIYGFDIQIQAINESKKKVIDSEKDINLICDSHHYMNNYIKEEIDIVLFNLGYLPGGDKTIVTKHEQTVEAIEIAVEKLAVGGLISIMTYPGHKEGAVEDEAVAEYVKSLHRRELSVLRLSVENIYKPCPRSYIIIKE